MPLSVLKKECLDFSFSTPHHNFPVQIVTGTSFRNINNFPLEIQIIAGTSQLPLQIQIVCGTSHNLPSRKKLHLGHRFTRPSFVFGSTT
jgi:hypothetical protein